MLVIDLHERATTVCNIVIHIANKRYITTATLNTHSPIHIIREKCAMRLMYFRGLDGKQSTISTPHIQSQYEQFPGYVSSVYSCADHVSVK